jgi:hypothetical protein
MMSKTSKWITWITSIILCLALLVLAGIWRLGLLPLLLPSPPPAQPLQASAGETVAPSGEIYLSQPGDSTGNGHPGTAPGSSSISTGPGTAATNSPASANGASNSQLQQEIETHYTTEMQNMAESYEDQLNTLEGKAYTEFTTDQKQGHPVSAMILASKYVALGNSLAQQCDDQFYALLAQFEAELQSNGLPQTAAIRAQQVYEYDKAVRKREILTAAAKLL